MEWRDRKQQRKTLAAKMKGPKYIQKIVKEKEIAQWDVTISCAALQVVEIGSLFELVDKVREERNGLCHRTEAVVQLHEFDKIKGCVQTLMREAGSIIPKEICDDCQKDLETSSKFICCDLCTVYTTTSKPSFRQPLV